MATVTGASERCRLEEVSGFGLTRGLGGRHGLLPVGVD